MSATVATRIVRRSGAVLAIAILLVTANGCGSAGSVTACPQRAWSKGWIDRVGGLATMEVRQSFRWNSTGLNGSCTGHGTQWVGVDWNGERTYCLWLNAFPYYADCDADPDSFENRSQNDYKASDVWAPFDWNVFGGSDGRVNIHTYVQGFKSGNAHTHCWLVATEGSGNPWGTTLHCDGGNS